MIMSMISPFRIVLTSAEERELSRRAARVRSEVRDASRARIVLAAARGTPNAQIAQDEGVHVDTVRKWRSRFAARVCTACGTCPAPVARRCSRRPPSRR